MEFLTNPKITDGTRGYRRVADRWELVIRPEDIDSVIYKFLMDLAYRGDLTEKSWSYIQEAVRANDVRKLSALVADKKGHKKNFYDNYSRYSERVQIFGLKPMGKVDWSK